MNEVHYAEASVRGKTIRVPATIIDGRRVIITGNIIKTARIFDEEFVEGELIADVATLIANLSDKRLQADILTFPQKIYEATPKYPYLFEWDNAAVACTKSFEDWWAKLPQESRKNARRAAKRGVTVQSAKFDDAFVKGIKDVYDEMPVRQGKKFWHYGKDLESVKRENSSYLDRSEFIGAYYNDELIGFLKFVYVDQVANMMQIISKAAHYDKRPMNALIAKAVEICQEKGISYLTYSKFTYGNKDKSQLSEFKRRNGFVQLDFPRYFIPLTKKGKVYLRLKLHRGLLGLLPATLIDCLWNVRAELLRATQKT
ncbi:MAG: hypothetical protein KF747_03680 [Nitrospira sp.]|nr:hypothetical protein [Nitrospira sp.]